MKKISKRNKAFGQTILIFQPRGQILNLVKPEREVASKGLMTRDTYWVLMTDDLTSIISLNLISSLEGAISQIRKPGFKVTQPISSRGWMPTTFPGSKLNILSPCHRGPHLRLAFPQPSRIFIHCLYHTPHFKPIPFYAFWMLPHLQWKVSRNTKASYSSHTKVGPAMPEPTSILTNVQLQTCTPILQGS